MDDEALLELELNWQPLELRDHDHRRQRPPAGTTAITAFGLFYTVVLWAVTLPPLSLVLPPPGNGVIAVGTCPVLVVGGLDMLLALWLAKSTWRAIGPGARGVIRPLMFLGPMPVFLGGSCALLMGFSFVHAAATGKLKAPPTEGVNWRISAPSPIDHRHGVSSSVAQSRCLQEGDGWKVPTKEELTQFNPPFTGKRDARYWLDDDKGDLLATIRCKGFDCAATPMRHAAPVDTALLAHTVCFKP